MIPKVLNYVWFGNSKPDKVKRCIESWYNYLPNWQINEWNSDNIDLSNAPPLIKRYINKEKWAYVSDYYRMQILKKYAGIYLDTDMYMIKPIPEDLLDCSFLACIESDGLINTGIFGVDTSEESRFLLSKILEYYEHSSSIDMSPNVVTPIIKRCYKLESLSLNRSEFYKDKGIIICGSEYFYPLHWTSGRLRKYRPLLTPNTVCIHEWTGSALGPDHFTESFESNYRTLINQFLGE